jgi:4-hydroxy-3-polyprenylbenzoate decarboxylase
LPALTLRAPWHGYSLGDWDAAWESFAERAAAGEWEKTGADTYARRRTGLTPETPVREAENNTKEKNREPR